MDMVALKILVPTDLRVASLNTAKLALEMETSPQVSVMLLHPLRLSNSITDLLFTSPETAMHERSSNEFKEALAILRSRFESKLKHLSLVAHFGKNSSAMESLLQAHRVDAIYLPRTYRLRLGAVVDPLPFLRRSGLPITEIDWPESNRSGEAEDLNSLFHSSPTQ